MTENRPQFDIVTFDCYGTLIDWERGIAAAFKQLGESGAADESQLLAAYAEAERAVEQEEYRPYVEVLAEASRRTAKRFGRDFTSAESKQFASSIASWKPFEDTNRAIERIRDGGIEIGILSNVDDALLSLTRRHFTRNFDIVVTAEQVSSYKPAHAHFEEARRRIGDQRWLHAAQSYFHDVLPAHELGIPVAWINRKGSPASSNVRPDFEFSNLTQLADWLGV